MIPLRDYNPTSRTPWVTYAILAANITVFLYQLQVRAVGGDAAYAELFLRLGVVPEFLTTPALWAQMSVPAPLTLMTSMFVHGDLLHLGGNMLYLWVFADNVEDSMGPLRFVVFYVLCGLGAALTQVALMPGSDIPMVGASGAIAGVLGAYMLLYPRAQVLTLVFLFIFIRVMQLPAVLLLGLWFLLQIISSTGGNGAGVAWFAHIGGFVVGVATIFAFARRRPTRPTRPVVIQIPPDRLDRR